MGFLPQPPAIALPQASTPSSAGGTLASVVPNLYWNPSSRGPLLVVGAERYTLVNNDPKPLDFFQAGMGGMFSMLGDMAALTGQKKPDATPLGQPPAQGWNPVQVATRFGGQVIRCGSVSVFAPLLNPDRSKPDNPLGDGDFMELVQEGMAMGMGGNRLLPLLASLSSSQLQQATSTGGLPLSSLDSKQRALAQPLLRRTLPFRFTQPPSFPDAGPLGAPPVIPNADQAQLRLRLSRGLNLSPSLPRVVSEGPGARMAMQFGNLVTEGQAPGMVRTLALRPGKAPNPMAMLALLGGSQAKGVPARKKPTELNPDSGSLNAPVSLAGVTTVDGLVQRIAQVTRQPLVADARIGKLSVSTRGGSARAGDLVQALCWAVGGAVRRISDGQELVYLLTEQVPVPEQSNPLMTMMGPLSGIMQDQRTAERLAKDAKIRLIRQKTLLALPRGLGASFGARFWQVAEAKPSPEGNTVPLGELSPELQKQAEERHKAFTGAIAAIPEGTPGVVRSEPQALTQVRCTQSIILELVAPTLGAVATLTTADGSEIHPELPVPTAPPPASLPTRIATRALAAPLPLSEGEASALVSSVVARGFTELRVAVPVGRESELAQLGKAAVGKVAVVAVLSPLEPLSEASPRDRSWTGKTLPEWLVSPESTKLLASLPPALAPSLSRIVGTDYVTPEGAEISGFVARVKRLLALPGVTGFALERLAAPGYREVRGGGMADGAAFFWQGGANARERVLFAKEQHTDAAELGVLNLAELISGGGSRSAWNKRTTARSDAFLQRLNGALTQAKLTPLSVLGTSEPPRWEAWTGKYPSGVTVTAAIRPALKVVSYSRMLAQPATFGDASDFAGFDEAEQFAGVLGIELERYNGSEATTRWDGIVIDLSDQPLATTLALIERAVASTK